MRLCTLPCWMETVHFSLQPLQIVCTGGPFNCFFAGSGQKQPTSLLALPFPWFRTPCCNCNRNCKKVRLQRRGTGDRGTRDRATWDISGSVKLSLGRMEKALRPRGKPSSAMTHAHGSSDPPSLAPHLGYKVHSIVLHRIGYFALLPFPV